MKFIQMSMILNSFISMWMNHPISLGSMLMVQSLTTSLMTILMTKNSWYSMILFITFSSGLMIMFMYMSSISSNEKFKSSFKLTMLTMTITMIYLLTDTDTMLMFKNKWMEKKIFTQENEEKKTLMKMLYPNKMYMILVTTLMILLVLLAVTNLINSFEGPLKKTYVKNNKMHY